MPHAGRERRRGGERPRELLYGLHSVGEALRARRRSLYRLYVRGEGRRAELEELASRARECGLEVLEQDPRQLSELARGGPSQGVVLEAGPLPEIALGELCLRSEGEPRWLVALDGVEDPQNLGAIARVAEASGARGLVLTERRAPPLSPAVSRASAGAIELLPVARVKNLVRGLAALKEDGFWIFGADPVGGKDLFELPDAQVTGDLVLVLGAEGRGLRTGIREALDHTIRIPLVGRVGSLNVSAAAAVILFEWRRRSRGDARA